MIASRRVRVWDPVVRTCHWLLVVLFALAYVSGELEAGFHVYVGYVLACTVAVRIVWGFAGTHHARFASFVRGPRATLAYLRAFAVGRPPHYLGHNPAGAWMVVLLLATLGATAFTGLMTYGAQGHGPLAPVFALQAPAARPDGAQGRQAKRRRSPAERFWKELHEGFVSAMLFLVLAHVAGALVSSLVHRENLTRAMITGDKFVEERRDGEA